MVSQQHSACIQGFCRHELSTLFPYHYRKYMSALPYPKFFLRVKNGTKIVEEWIHHILFSHVCSIEAKRQDTHKRTSCPKKRKKQWWEIIILNNRTKKTSTTTKNDQVHAVAHIIVCDRPRHLIIEWPIKCQPMIRWNMASNKPDLASTSNKVETLKLDWKRKRRNCWKGDVN